MKMPYTKSLMRSIPKLDDPSHTRLATIPGRPPDLVHPPQGCRFAPRCAYARDKCRQDEPPLVQADASPITCTRAGIPSARRSSEERDAELERAGDVVVGVGEAS